MQVLTQEFIDAAKKVLNELDQFDSMTREKLCHKLGLNKEFVGAIGILLSLPDFKEFESVRAKGIRRRKPLGLAGKDYVLKK